MRNTFIEELTALTGQSDHYSFAESNAGLSVNDVACHNLSFTVVAVSEGIDYGALGYSQQAANNYVLLMSFPTIPSAAPEDPVEMQSCVRSMVWHPRPSSLRTPALWKLYFQQSLPDLRPNKWQKIARGEGSDGMVAVLCTEAALCILMNWIESPEFCCQDERTLRQFGVDAKNSQVAQIKLVASRITSEDHMLDGYSCSWMLVSMVCRVKLLACFRQRDLDPRSCCIVDSHTIINTSDSL